MSPVRTAEQAAEALLTVKDIEARLSVGNTTAKRLISTGEIASVKVGRLRRVTPAALEEYLARIGAA